jgi:hypothetical protein
LSPSRRAAVACTPRTSSAEHLAEHLAQPRGLAGEYMPGGFGQGYLAAQAVTAWAISAPTGPPPRMSRWCGTAFMPVTSPLYPPRLHPIRAELAALQRAKRPQAVVSEFNGLEHAPQALATVFDRGSPYSGRRVVGIAARSTTTHTGLARRHSPWNISL